MTDERLLGRGIYDAAEVARLVRRGPDDIARWARPTEDGDALLLPRAQRLLSFFDLVTALVTAELGDRGVPLYKIRDARRTLAAHFDVEWPLAHAAILNKLANAGSDVYVLLGPDWLDASRGGQVAIPEVVAPLLHMLEFDADDHMAALWRPAEGVVVDPRVQAGAPCLTGTRLTTELLATLAEAEGAEDVARDYDLDPRLVAAAVEFERRLAA